MPGTRPWWGGGAAAACGRAAAALMLLTAAAVAAPPPAPIGSRPRVEPVVEHPGLGSALEAARRRGELLVVAFDGPGGSALATADERFLSEGGPMHLVRFDAAADPQRAAGFGVRTTPAIVAVTGEGRLVARAEADGVPETAERLVQWCNAARKAARAGRWLDPADAVGDAEAAAAPSARSPRVWAVLMGHTDPAIRRRTRDELASLGRDGVAIAVEALGHEALGTRVAAAEAIRDLATDPPAFDPWADATARAERLAAVRAWWEAGPAWIEAAEPVAGVNEAIAALGSGDFRRRTDALAALSAMGEPALPLIEPAIVAARARRDAGAAALLEEARWTILVPDAIAEAHPGLRLDLARGDSGQRRRAAETLGRAGAAGLPALSRLSVDDDTTVQEAAVRALSEIGGDDAIDAMARVLDAPDAQARMVTAQRLGETERRRALAPLAGVLDDPEELVVLTAIGAMQHVIDERDAHAQGTPLLACLEDPRWRVRAAACKALGKLEVPAAAGAIEPLLLDGDAFVVHAALEALIDLNRPPSPDRLRAMDGLTASLRARAAVMLMKRGDDDGVALIVEWYDAADASERESLLRAALGIYLWETENLDRFAPLIERGLAEDAARLRRAAAEAMASRKVPVVEPWVTAMLGDDDPRVRAAGLRQAIRAMAYHYGVAADVRRETDSFGVLRGDDADAKVAPDLLGRHDAWAAAVEAMDGADPALAAIVGLAHAPADEALATALAPLDEEAARAALVDALVSDANATALLLHRMPWPAGEPLVHALLESDAAAALTAQTSAASPPVRAVLRQPERVAAALAEAEGDAYEAMIDELLGDDDGPPRLGPFAEGRDELLRLLLSSDAARARAVAVFAIGRLGVGEPPSSDLLAALDDADAGVRRIAVAGLGDSGASLDERIARAGPRLTDADAAVRRLAAWALLPSSIRGVLDGSERAFAYDGRRVWVADAFQRSTPESNRPIRPVADAMPEPLAEAIAAAESAGLLEGETADAVAVLRAAFGDGSGLRAMLDAWRAAPESPPSPLLALGLPLTGDEAFLEPLRALAERTESEWEVRELLNYLRGVRGSAVRDFRRELSMRLRELR